LIEAHWRQLIVSSDHPSADEQVAEAIARVLSRYAVDYSSGVKVTVSHDGTEVTYVVARPMRLAGALRASRAPHPGAI
jgi:hypothetical protein